MTKPASRKAAPTGSGLSASGAASRKVPPASSGLSASGAASRKVPPASSGLSASGAQRPEREGRRRTGAAAPREPAERSEARSTQRPEREGRRRTGAAAPREPAERSEAQSTPHDPDEYIEAVLQLVERIPPGRVMAYGAIAECLYDRFGRGSARRVGTIMAQYGGSVPWYRVVSGGGRLPPGHEATARSRLEAEGVHFRGPRIRMLDYAWWPAEYEGARLPSADVGR